MSKIDYYDAANFVEVDKIIAEVLKLSDAELLQQYGELRCESFEAYGLTYVLSEYIRGGNGNVMATNEPLSGFDKASTQIPFRMHIPLEIYYKWASLPAMSTERWEKRIVLAAVRSGVKSNRLHITSSKYEELVGNNELMAATTVNEVSPGLTVVTVPDNQVTPVCWDQIDGGGIRSAYRDHNLSKDALQKIETSVLIPTDIPVKELPMDKIVQAMTDAGVQHHVTRGEYIVFGNEDEFRKFALEIQKQTKLLK